MRPVGTHVHYDINTNNAVYCANINRHFVDSTIYEVAGQWKDDEMYSALSYTFDNGVKKLNGLAAKKYTTGNLIIRSTASKEGEKLAVVPIGVEIDVFEEGNESVLIKYEDKEGYVYESYLTTDQEEAIQASKEYDAEQAAKAAAEKNSSSKKSSKKKKKSSGGKKEVSRQKYDDCDGSGHGYYEITYSDGSTKIVEY